MQLRILKEDLKNNPFNTGDDNVIPTPGIFWDKPINDDGLVGVGTIAIPKHKEAYDEYIRRYGNTVGRPELVGKWDSKKFDDYTDDEKKRLDEVASIDSAMKLEIIKDRLNKIINVDDAKIEFIVKRDLNINCSVTCDEMCSSNFFLEILSCFKSALLFFKAPKKTKITYDNIQKKIIIKNWPTKVIKITFRFGSLQCQSVNQCIAFVLHELGHVIDTVGRFYMRVGIGATLINGLFILTCIIIKICNNSISISNKWKIGTSILALLAHYLSVYIVEYNSYRNEVKADDFAIKCGYGKYLIEALYDNKLDIWRTTTYNENENSILKILKNILNPFRKMHDEYHITDKKRYDMLTKKTKEYDISEKNIDRTEDIQENLQKIKFRDYRDNKMQLRILNDTILYE